MNALAWKRRLGKSFFANLFQTKNSRKVVLLYHAVGAGPWAISENDFSKQIQWLKSHCQVLPLSRLLTQPAEKTATQVAITFDDGYACLHDIAAPILKAENISATLYVNTGWLGNSEGERKCSNTDLGHYPGEKFLIWDEVKYLEKQGWEIGSHGVDHIDLTKRSMERVMLELNDSKQTIESELQEKCSQFAYTFGRETRSLRKAVLDAGYQYAAAAHHAVLKDNSNPIAFPRINIAREYSLEDFKNIILGKWDFLGNVHAIKHWLGKR